MKHFNTHALIEWYHQNKRNLPFRESKNPYAIWISEIMAQQTQISTMLPYYQRWMNRFPTVESLAQAKEEDILKHWEGLGYYTRARNIHKAAKMIVDQFSGQFPQTKQDLLTLPGIGDYSASAISSIAYGQHEIAVDGNVIRVLSRWLESDLDYSKEANKRQLQEDLKEVSLDVDAGDFTESLMELGALICTPKAYQCETCPLQSTCRAFKHKTVDSYPIKKTKKESPIEHYKCYVSYTKDGLLIDTVPQDTLMKGMSRLPQLPKDTPSPFLENEFLFTINHVFSHKKWIIDVYQSKTLKEEKKEWKYIPLQEIMQRPFIGVHNKILDKLNLF